MSRLPINPRTRKNQKIFGAIFADSCTITERKVFSHGAIIICANFMAQTSKKASHKKNQNSTITTSKNEEHSSWFIRTSKIYHLSNYYEKTLYLVSVEASSLDRSEGVALTAGMKSKSQKKVKRISITFYFKEDNCST